MTDRRPACSSLPDRPGRWADLPSPHRSCSRPDVPASGPAGNAAPFRKEGSAAVRAAKIVSGRNSRPEISVFGKKRLYLHDYSTRTMKNRSLTPAALRRSNSVRPGAVRTATIDRAAVRTHLAGCRLDSFLLDN